MLKNRVGENQLSIFWKYPAGVKTETYVGHKHSEKHLFFLVWFLSRGLL